jgi:dTDP-4-amino-4,6-dideoxygalactose transaminase
MGMLRPVPDSQAGSRWRVPWFDGRGPFRDEWPGIAGQVHRVFDHDKFAHGPMTAELEAAIRRYTGAWYAIGVTSGADALYLILRAAGVGEGDEVIVPAFGARSSMAPVHRARATPVFGDIEPNSGTMAPDSVRAALSTRTKVLLPLHFYARMPDMPALQTIADDAGVVLVEDCAQAMGMRQRGVHAGRFGAAGALSFSPGTTLGALGDAGMVITDDAEFARRCTLMRHHGRIGEVGGHASDVSSASAMPGVNSKMDEIQAAVLLARLGSLDGAIAQRRAVAARYTERLAGVTGVRLPVLPEDQVWPAYVIEADRRDALAGHLAQAGVQTEVPHRYRPGSCPAAEAAAKHILALPVYPGLPTGDIDYVCAAITRFSERGHR